MHESVDFEPKAHQKLKSLIVIVIETIVIIVTVETIRVFT